MHSEEPSIPNPAASVFDGNGAPESRGEPSAEKPPPVAGDGYEVHLDQFEGPLDLLLYLIREEKVDVTDIPIARITEQYLESIRDLDELDLERAGEYLLMAATLMRIKAKMLIPKDPDEEEEEEEDPRAELVRRLLEYQEFKRVAEVLGRREEEWRSIFGRAASPLPDDGTDEPEELDHSLIDLFRAFKTILDRLETEQPLEMEAEEYAVDEQMAFIRFECARREEGVAFSALFFEVRSRQYVITTFLALLEMIRESEVQISQVDRFGEIWITKRTEAAPAHE